MKTLAKNHFLLLQEEHTLLNWLMQPMVSFRFPLVDQELEAEF